MSMSEIRKKAQDRLRRKFGYRTSDNYNRGTILYKEGRMNTRNGKTWCHDINIEMDNNAYWIIDDRSEPEPITIQTAEYVHGRNGFQKQSEHRITMTLEELDLIHAIAHQMSEENDWEGQAKEYKKFKRSITRKHTEEK